MPRATSVTWSVDMEAAFVLSTALDVPKECPESQRAERGGQMGTKSWEGWGTSEGAGDRATNPLDLGRGSGLGGGGATSEGDGLSRTGSCPARVSRILSCDPEGPLSRTGGPSSGSRWPQARWGAVQGLMSPPASSPARGPELPEHGA